MAGEPRARHAWPDAVQVARPRRRPADLRSHPGAILRQRITNRTQTLAHVALPFGILDRYVAFTYLRLLGLSALALVGVFYVSAFIELSEKVFRGTGTWSMLGTFMIFTTPQYLYYIVPLSVLLASLVTVAILTKNSELIVMKACGISLYRIALPMVAGAVAAGAFLFALEQTVLGPANRRAQTSVTSSAADRPKRSTC